MLSAVLTLLMLTSTAIWWLWPPPLNPEEPAQALPAKSTVPNKMVGGEPNSVPARTDTGGVPAIEALAEPAAKEAADKIAMATRPADQPENKTEPPEKKESDGVAAPAEFKVAAAPDEPRISVAAVEHKAVVAAVEPKVVEPPKPDRLAEARTLVESGHIEAARTLLTPLAADNDPTALLMLGETFDPNLLAAWNARGTTADADRARGFYKRALAQGEIKAQQRLEALE